MSICPRKLIGTAGCSRHTSGVSELNRRRFLAGLAAATVAGVGVGRCTISPSSSTVVLAAAPVAPTGFTAAAGGAPAAAGAASAQLLLPPAPSARVDLPGGGVLSSLPGRGDLLALTVDDGVNSDVVRLYTEFAKDTGIRLTFFVNGTYGSWTDNRGLLRPLVDSGQIQLGNHTWSHPDLTTVTKSIVAEQISRNDTFLKHTYGVEAAPYLRPPYGKHNAAVDAVAADLGYTVTTLWSGSLSDSTVITEDYLLKMADRYFTPQTIVIGHLNHLPVTHVYPQLVDIIRARQLRTVTLNDVFRTPS
jgi:peptidoglycan/xylan/chitin deacetylase (PgdA/CDA1 family)